MKICILGTARSGTTALYVLLQEILLDCFGNRVDFVYEPFLWERSLFNDRYESVLHRFNSMNAISPEGIYHHKSLPLLIQETAPFLQNQFLRGLFHPANQATAQLLKLIRACGRYPLLYDIAPETYFIYIIRNPVDCLNSLTQNFSFFGGEFHPDDFPKFLAEVNGCYGEKHTAEDFPDSTEREFLFWYYVNRFALESFQKRPRPPLLLCYEEILHNKPGFVLALCSHLGLPFKEQYLAYYEKRVGSLSQQFKLPLEQNHLFQDSLRQYAALLDEFNLPHSFPMERVLDKYEFSPVLPDEKGKLYGLNPLVLMRKIMDNTRELQNRAQEHVALQQSVEDFRKQAADLEQQLHWHQYQLCQQEQAASLQLESLQSQLQNQQEETQSALAKLAQAQIELTQEQEKRQVAEARLEQIRQLLPYRIGRALNQIPRWLRNHLVRRP